jgi:phage terminase large subunit GpA-like protein
MPTSYNSIEEMILSAAESVRPAERLTVSEAAERHRKLNNPGSFVGDWSNDMTPYLVEPQDLLTSVAYRAMIFVGPAQCGKTDMYLNWHTHTVVCDPADMMLIQTSQTTARDFSKRRIDRLHRHSPDVGKRLITGRNYDNTFDKRYSSGMMATLSWPAINELSGKPIPRLWLTDYDRMPQDIDGEGNPFDLARKRATSFRSHGMCAAESSPGFMVDTAKKWIPQTPHEAPPTQGILSLFNRGDRRLWFWRCVSCHVAFEPDFGLLHYPSTNDHLDAAEQAVLVCPGCGQVYHHDYDEKTGMPGKMMLNRAGRWVKDGMTWHQSGEIIGKPYRSDIGSFWLKGVAATFSDWKGLVLNYLKAEQEYERTGSQEALKTTVNVDQGNPFRPKGTESDRQPDELKNRAADLGQYLVPQGVRFLLATIDVQKNRFVVQVHGIGYGSDITVIDRFEIRKSARRDPEDETQFLWVNPGAYKEDWHLIITQVMQKTYELGDGSGRRMAVKMTFCDSGGREGVTANAYDFHRYLRDGPPADALAADSTWKPGLNRKFQLLKGDPKPGAPRVHLAYPDSERKDRHAGARGEIPVLFLNTNSLKDTLDKLLDRRDPHGGRINFPKWLPDTFYTELTVEVRTPKGWENPKRFRNESWDLLYYCIGAMISKHIGVERPGFWDDPPKWAEEWEHNDLVYNPKTSAVPFESKPRESYDLAALAAQLA